MCGLVGIISVNGNGFTGNEADALRDMIYVDTMRGADSTGIMYGDNRGNVQIHKAAIPGFMFLGTEEWKKSRQEIFTSGKWAMAHNRAATRGAKTDENAHPFVVNDNIILMQNGTYKGSHDHLKKVDVDTEACAHVIAEEEDISTALKKINAAYAFIWFNVKTKTLYMVRNDERPLFICKAKSGTMFFASEPEIITLAASRNNITLAEDPYLIKDAHLCSFKFDGSRMEEEYTDIDIKYDWSKNSPFQQTTNLVHFPGREHMLVDGKGRHRHRFGLPNRQGLVLGDALLMIRDSYTPGRSLTFVNYLQDEVIALKKEPRTFIVEGIDYVKRVETDVSDRSFYAFGTIIDPDNPTFHTELVAWMVEGSEKEVMRYVADHMFRVEIDYLMRKGYHGQWLTCLVVKDDVHIVADLSAAVEVKDGNIHVQ